MQSPRGWRWVSDGTYTYSGQKKTLWPLVAMLLSQRLFLLHVIGCLHSVPEACNAVEMKQNLIWSKGKDRRIDAKKAGTSKILQMPSTTYLLSRCLGCFLSVWGLLELNGFNQTRADRQIPASKRANKQANKQTNRKNEK